MKPDPLVCQLCSTDSFTEIRLPVGPGQPSSVSELAFLATAVTLAITPGPGMAYVVARTVAGGRTDGLASCLGTSIGGLLQVLAAAAGHMDLSAWRA